MKEMRKSLSGAVVAALAISGIFGSAAIPAAAETPPEVAVPAGPSVWVDPGSTTVNVAQSTYVSELTLPGTPTSTQADRSLVPDSLDNTTGDALVSTEVFGATITSFPAGDRSQTFIEIPASSAPSEYAFALDMPEGATAAVEHDGSVAIRDRQGILLSGYDVPWAIDADGNAVPTSFRIDGDVLVQSVDLSATSAFPVIADPSDLWGWAGCIGTVLAEVAGNALVAAKFAKLVTKFGTIQRTVEIMVRAWRASSDANKRTQAVIAAVGGLGAEILGVTAIKNACFS